MRDLSLKIFLWFWLAVLAGSLAFVAVATWFPSQTFLGRAAKYFSFNMATTGRLGVDLYEQSGPESLETFLGRIETISAFKLYIVTERGTPLRHAILPAGAKELSKRALSQGEVLGQDWTSHPLFAQPITSSRGTPYVIILELPGGLVNLLSQMSHAIAMRFAVALLASGLVCLLMVRYLTSPIRKLQSAVRRFAQGDLSVRVASKIGSRKDEIANLGRDFDVMAARIETLMHAHERLLRDVAHELRSPLTRLNVALEIARKHSDAKMTGFLDRISTEGEKLSALITQVLALSRLENIEVERHFEPIELEKLISRIVHDANFEGQNQGDSVTFQWEQPVTLLVDGRLIHSAIENVVRNALRFTPPGSQVEISQAVQPINGRSHAVVLIADRGPGVPHEALKDLFSPFFRVTDNSERTRGGTGIGLAIAYHAVTLHGGFIHAMNRTSGGLTVQISLPLDNWHSMNLIDGCSKPSALHPDTTATLKH